MRIFITLLLALLFSTTLYGLDDNRTKISVATYDRTIITQSSVYYSLYLLSADPKTLKALQELNTKIDAVLQKMLVEEEPTVVNELQSKLRSYEKKKRTVKKVLKAKQNKQDKGLLDRFINKHYSNSYGVIIPSKFLYDSYYGKVILNTPKVDITETIIADLEKAVEAID